MHCRHYRGESGPTCSPHCPSQAFWKFTFSVLWLAQFPLPPSICPCLLPVSSTPIVCYFSSWKWDFSVTIWWFFEHYDWHFAIWAELILCIVFLSTFLICPFIHSFIHPSSFWSLLLPEAHISLRENIILIKWITYSLIEIRMRGEWMEKWI